MTISQKKIAILQSNFLPWRGYFSLINSVDEFIFFDEAQYTSGDWRNRNYIKGPSGKILITIPVKKDKLDTRIDKIQISSNFDKEKLLKTIKMCYQKTFFFEEVFDLIQREFNKDYTHLSDLNINLICKICSYLNINKFFLNSSDISKNNFGKNERLVEICINRDATCYLSGPSAKDYINKKYFDDKNISIHWFRYTDAINYHQPWGNFIGDLSIIDLLFNLGKKTIRYL